jgi:rhodanese-related sulfurtransferase
MKARRNLWTAIFVVMVLIFGFGCVSTQTTAEPAKTEAKPSFTPYHDIVDAAFVKQYVKVPMPEGVMIIDSRPKKTKYDKGHIPMAVSIPYSQFDKMTDMLPKDKNALLIFYCEGVKCSLSHKSAFKAEALGYKNVKVYAKGFPEWVKIPGNYAQVPPEWMKKQYDGNADMVVVDSRPKRTKYDKGHLPGAISIPDSQFAKMTDQLPDNKEQLMVFYCGGFKCRLSHKSAKKAIALGYTNVKVYSAGYPAWKAMVSASESSPVKAGAEEGSIDIASFEKIMKENPGSIMLIDVREPDEYATGAFKTAVNIPTDQLEKKINDLPTDKPIVFVCSTGARSGEAYYMVKDLRPQIKDVFYLEAETTYNKDGSVDIKKNT